MIIDDVFIEQYCALEEGQSYHNDPIANPDATLFTCDRDTLQHFVRVKYNFEVAGQAAIWAVGVMEHMSKLDRMISQLVYRLYKGDYTQLKNREVPVHFYNAMCFEALLIAHELCKVLPTIHDDYVEPNEVTTLKDTIEQYKSQYQRDIADPLKIAATTYDGSLYCPPMYSLTFQPVMAFLPDYVKMNNPIQYTQVSIELFQQPALGLGPAISDYLRNACLTMQSIAIGDMRWVNTNKPILRDMVSALLYMITYVSAETVFCSPLLRSTAALNKYAMHLDVTGKEHTTEEHSRWLDLAIPLGNSFINTPIIHTTPI